MKHIWTWYDCLFHYNFSLKQADFFHTWFLRVVRPSFSSGWKVMLRTRQHFFVSSSPFHKIVNNVDKVDIFIPFCQLILNKRGTINRSIKIIELLGPKNCRLAIVLYSFKSTELHNLAYFLDNWRYSRLGLIVENEVYISR